MIKSPYFSEMCATSMVKLGSAILLVLSIASWLPSSANARGIIAETILRTTKTITGEKIVYPLSCAALVEAVVVTILPGEKTRLHRNGVPMVTYILEGELSVYYEGIGVKTFSQGSSFVETRKINHYGENAKRSPVRVFLVYAGADGSKTSYLPSSETGS